MLLKLNKFIYFMAVVGLSNEVYQKLKKYCKKEGLKIKSVVDRAIEKYLKEEVR